MYSIDMNYITYLYSVDMNYIMYSVDMNYITYLEYFLASDYLKHAL